jgi:hypothetical protein
MVLLKRTFLLLLLLLSPPTTVLVVLVRFLPRPPSSVSEPNIRLTVKPRPIPIDDELPFELESESKSSIYYTFDSGVPL